MEAVHLVGLHEADRLAATAEAIDAVEDHRARGERDRLECRGALPVDGGGGDGHGEACAEQRLARDVAAGRALLQRRAHHDVLDSFRSTLARATPRRWRGRAALRPRWR